MERRHITAGGIHYDVLTLRALPREMVHNVLNNLPLKNILELAANHHDGKASEATAYSGLSGEARTAAAYFDQCVITHLTLRDTFSAGLEDLSKLSSIWSIYNNAHCLLKDWTSSNLHDDVRMELGLPVSMLQEAPNCDKIAEQLIHHVWALLEGWRHELQNIASCALDKLPSHHDSKKYTLLYGKLERPWSRVTDAIEEFNKRRSQQLNRMADLFESYPELLKKAGDPAQVPRKNIKHITDQLRGYAKRIARGKPARCVAYPWHQFREDLFYIVPFDALLHTFSRTLEQYPLEQIRVLQDREPKANEEEAAAVDGGQPRPVEDQVDDDLVNKLAATTLTMAEDSISKGKLIYPPLIRKAIEEAILGLPYVYETFTPFSDKAVCKIPRTKFTPYSAHKYQSKSPNHDEAFFMSPNYPHMRDVYAESKMHTSDRYRLPLPYDEKELKWLEAFLKASDWMAKMGVP